MVEYWNVGLDKEVTHFIASLSREILPIYHYSIFLEPIIPSFHYSNIPIAERSGAKFIMEHGARRGEMPISSSRR